MELASSGFISSPCAKTAEARAALVTSGHAPSQPQASGPAHLTVPSTQLHEEPRVLLPSKPLQVGEVHGEFTLPRDWQSGPSLCGQATLCILAIGFPRTHLGTRQSPGPIPRVPDIPTVLTPVSQTLGPLCCLPPPAELGVMPGEASLAVPPSVLTLGVNRNIKSLLGGQETGNNQNIVS
jgi:hypothetical protein